MNRLRRLKEIVEGATAGHDHVANVMSGAGWALTEEQISRWRELANIQAEHDAGFAYDGYVRLKLASCRAFVSSPDHATSAASRPKSPFARAIAEVVDAWAAEPARHTNRGSSSPSRTARATAAFRSLAG